MCCKFKWRVNYTDQIALKTVLQLNQKFLYLQVSEINLKQHSVIKFVTKESNDPKFIHGWMMASQWIGKIDLKLNFGVNRFDEKDTCCRTILWIISTINKLKNVYIMIVKSPCCYQESIFNEISTR